MSPVKSPEQTRQRILDSAFTEFYQHGFQGSSLNRIIATAETTKGGLFHHFDGKQALGYAVIDEVILNLTRNKWILPISRSTNPIKEIKQILQNGLTEMQGEGNLALCQGCPLNNLAQEMSSLDEGFRQRIEDIYYLWRNAIARSFQRAIDAGTVRADANPESIGAFIVATLTGMIGTAKNTQNIEILKLAAEQLWHYLDTLRV